MDTDGSGQPRLAAFPRLFAAGLAQPPGSGSYVAGGCQLVFRSVFWSGDGSSRMIGAVVRTRPADIGGGEMIAVPATVPPAVAETPLVGMASGRLVESTLSYGCTAGRFSVGRGIRGKAVVSLR